MHRLKTRLTAVAVGLLGLLGVFAMTAAPASASTSQCAIPGFGGQDYTFYIGTATHRAGCMTAHVYHNGDYYWFQVRVQDWDDVGIGGYTSDDAGFTRIQFRTPGTSDWHDASYDWNSADFNVATYTSPTYHLVFDGPAFNFGWRVQMTSHFRCVSFVQCGNSNGPWQYRYNYGSEVNFN